MDYDQRLPGLIGAITKEAADAAAKKLLDPSRATIAVAGPWNLPSPSPQPPPPPAGNPAGSGETGSGGTGSSGLDPSSLL
jgi:hypothetical protein